MKLETDDREQAMRLLADALDSDQPSTVDLSRNGSLYRVTVAQGAEPAN